MVSLLRPAVLHCVAAAAGAGLRRSSPAEKKVHFPRNARVPDNRPTGSAFLQHGSGNRACPRFWTKFSLAPYVDGPSHAVSIGNDTSEGGAQCDPFFAHGLGTAGLVELQRTIAVDTRHCAGVCRFHYSGNDGNRGTLFR